MIMLILFIDPFHALVERLRQRNESRSMLASEDNLYITNPAPKPRAMDIAM
jgi:hypothetical protein